MTRRHVEWLDVLFLLGVHIHVPMHLLTYLLTYGTQNNQCFGDWPVI